MSVRDTIALLGDVQRWQTLGGGGGGWYPGGFVNCTIAGEVGIWVDDKARASRREGQKPHRDLAVVRHEDLRICTMRVSWMSSRGESAILIGMHCQEVNSHPRCVARKDRTCCELDHVRAELTQSNRHKSLVNGSGR